MAYTPLGFSIPDLAIVGAFSGPVGAAGGPLAVTVDVSNLGQSSIPEPLNQLPGAPSRADAPASLVAVFYSPRAHVPLSNQTLLGTFDVPAIPQNRLARVTGTVNLPSDAVSGGFLTLLIDPGQNILDLNRTNNVFRIAEPLPIAADLPELQATALGLPPVLNPGDAVIPQVRVANVGPGSTASQAPVVVQVVASTDTTFGPGDQILATFTVNNIPGLALSPSRGVLPGDVGLVDPPNQVTLDAMSPVLLPATGAPYFVGVIVDPLDAIQELSEVDRGPDPTLEQIRVVGDMPGGFPPSNLAGTPAPTDAPFPFPPFATPTGTPIFGPITQPPDGPIGSPITEDLAVAGPLRNARDAYAEQVLARAGRTTNPAARARLLAMARRLGAMVDA